MTALRDSVGRLTSTMSRLGEIIEALKKLLRDDRGSIGLGPIKPKGDGGDPSFRAVGAQRPTSPRSDRTFVKDQDELLQTAMRAAGGNLDDLTPIKPGWWQGQLPDGTTVKIEWEPTGHATTNEGPHVTVRVPRDPAIGPKSGWKVIQKVFIRGREEWSS
jgi:hypothetical protein